MSKHYDHRLTAARFAPEAERIRAEATRQLEAIRNPPPHRKGPDMPPVTDTTSKLLAFRIRKVRLELGLTLSQLGEAIGANGEWHPSQSQLSQIETSKRAVSVPELRAIAEALGRPVDWFVREGGLCDACGQELP